MTLLSFPDFLLGLPAGPVGAGGNGTSFSNIFFSSVVTGIPDVGQRASAADLFALDDWKVTRTLTMNLGVRVEVDGQPSEVNGRESNFFPQFYVAPPAGGFTSPDTSGFVLPDNFSGNAPAGFPRENSTLLNHPVQTHPEPRVGFAWQPFSSTDLVLRGGYGIYANRPSSANWTKRFQSISCPSQTANGGVVSEFSRVEVRCPSVRPIEPAMREPRMDPQSTVFPAQPCRP
jgi:hypothetical protein